MKKYSAFVLAGGFLFCSAEIVALPSTNVPLRLVLAGDVMLGNAHTQRVPKDWSDPLRAAEPWLKGPHLTLVNLEGVIADDSAPNAKNCSRCYSFRMSPSAADALVSMGVDAVSLANNHVFDFGHVGFTQTQHHLSRVGIQFHGGRDFPWVELAPKIRLIAFATNRGMWDPRVIEEAQNLVRKASAQGYLVIVSTHMGAEGANALYLKSGNEIFLGENRGNPEAFAHAVIEAGADVVWGHGPHVPRAMELYQGRMIAYSLGNFATYGGFNLSGPQALAPLLEVQLGSDGTLKCWKVHSFKQVWPGGVHVDPSHQAYQTIARLSKEQKAQSWASLTQLGCP